METIRYGLQRLRESLFAIPSAVVAACILAAVGAIRLDTIGTFDDLPLLVSASLDGGRGVATAVAGATITVAAIVFSMTALSSQIAASDYSPRAVAGFFEDRFQQMVIGLTVGTFAYSLIVLTGLAGVVEADDRLGRSVSVTLAVVLGIASGLAIVAYIDHSLRRMRVGSVVRRIAESTTSAVRHARGGGGAAEAAEERMEHGPESTKVWARRTGWVRSIDASGLCRALPPGTLARIEVRMGEFVAAGDLLATVWGADGVDPGRAAANVRRAVYVGRTRTASRDPGFGLRQLADIALRALSPGINDPTTAVEVLYHLKLPMREILSSDPPPRVFSLPGGRRVFVPEAPSRSGRVHAAFSEIRLAAGGQPAVLQAMIDVIADLVGELRDKDLASRTGALLEEASLALEAAEASGLTEPDMERIRSAAERLGLPEAKED